jgi:sulfite reductase (NADPH) hemoprotein beta-component
MTSTLNEAGRAKPSRNETLKEACPTLAGSIGATLANAVVDRFSEDDCEFLKFHGLYQSDDRDLRKTAKRYIFLVRLRLPGGVMRPNQYLTFDRLAAQYGNDTLRITSRQTFQLHGVVKSGLGLIMKGIHESLCTTLAACGDVARNVMAPPAPATDSWGEQVQADARMVSEALLPRTPAYHQIWVDGQPLDLQEPADKDFVDPLYGKTYLPRKFKVAFTAPPLNDVDVFSNCLGFVAIAEQGQLAGYNLLAGGGLGMSYGTPATYPRLADVIGFVPRAQVVQAARAVLSIHRDFGDRSNRKHARLKFILQEKGVEWFRNQLQERLGFALEQARPVQFTRQGDLFGWHRQLNGKYFLGLYIEAGRIKDTIDCQLKTALRRVVERFQTEVRLTPSQNVLLTDVSPTDIETIASLLAEHGVAVKPPMVTIRQTAMVCPSLPTCGRALAEAERVFPSLLSGIEQALAEVGLKDERIIIRMTGCPNNCARPLLAEIGLVGKAPNKYHLYLGGNEAGTRLNHLFKESIRSEELVNELRPLFIRFARERQPGERFGQFCERVILSPQQSARPAERAPQSPAATCRPACELAVPAQG